MYSSNKQTTNELSVLVYFLQNLRLQFCSYFEASERPYIKESSRDTNWRVLDMFPVFVLSIETLIALFEVAMVKLLLQRKNIDSNVAPVFAQVTLVQRVLFCTTCSREATCARENMQHKQNHAKKLVR